MGLGWGLGLILPPLSTVVVLCMHSALLGGAEQSVLLGHMGDAGLADGRLVFLPYDTLLFALPHRNRSYTALTAHGPLRKAYDAVLTVTLESGSTEEALAAAHLEPEQVGPPDFHLPVSSPPTLALASPTWPSSPISAVGTDLGSPSF